MIKDEEVVVFSAYMLRPWFAAWTLGRTTRSPARGARSVWSGTKPTPAPSRLILLAKDDVRRCRNIARYLSHPRIRLPTRANAPTNEPVISGPQQICHLNLLHTA